MSDEVHFDDLDPEDSYDADDDPIAKLRILEHLNRPEDRELIERLRAELGK